jgi:threonyl-tRNA synthetase
MPDVHAFCADMGQAKQEMKRRMRLCAEVLEGIGLERDDYELGVRFTREFYEGNREFVESLVRDFGKPALVEMWEERFFYFVLKWEFNFVDNQEKASALSTDQIDIENAQRYGIAFTDERGEKAQPIILHCSPSGAIERDIWALLEKAYKEEKAGRKPSLPLWLAPTQVRIVPVSDKYVEASKQLMGSLLDQGVRADIDDRTESVQKRVRQAETEWVNYVVVFGQREAESGALAVRDRARSEEMRAMGVQELVDEIKGRTRDRPFAPNPLPKMLSERPSFS